MSRHMKASAGGVDLSVRLGPLQLANPVINASGTMEIFELATSFGLDILKDPPVAAYVPKTITLDARQGNPPPRISETTGGVINSIGLANEGIESFLRGLESLVVLPCPIIVSIGGFSHEDYVELATRLSKALDARFGGGAETWKSRVGLELNISCPNVHSGCVSIGSSELETREVTARVREVWQGLLIAKLTPNVTELAPIARAAVAGGADAIAAVNTFKALVLDKATLKPYLGNVYGGLSGPAVKPLALRFVYEIFRAVDVPIVGMGGIGTVGDVLDFMACGARVVAVGAASFRDPWLCRKLAHQLASTLAERGLRLDDLVGCAHLK